MSGTRGEDEEEENEMGGEEGVSGTSERRENMGPGMEKELRGVEEKGGGKEEYERRRRSGHN